VKSVRDYWWYAGEITSSKYERMGEEGKVIFRACKADIS
jgi:hypothetical protein